MNKLPLFLIALACGIMGIAVVVVGTIGLVSAQPQNVMAMPSRQTHGDIFGIYAADILGGPHECGKNIQLNDLKSEECQNRLPYPVIPRPG
jgi:hypothetical protein